MQTNHTSLVVMTDQEAMTSVYELFSAGRGGETIRSICKASGAKITCDKESEGTLLLSRLIKISGTQKEVAAAKVSRWIGLSCIYKCSMMGQNFWLHTLILPLLLTQHLILEKVSEDEELRKRIAHSTETRVPRKQPISVKREEVTEPGGRGELAVWKNTSSSMGQAAPLEVSPHKGGGDMSVEPKESSWEKPVDDQDQDSPEMAMFQSK